MAEALADAVVAAEVDASDAEMGEQAEQHRRTMQPILIRWRLRRQGSLSVCLLSRLRRRGSSPGVARWSEVGLRAFRMASTIGGVSLYMNICLIIQTNDSAVSRIRSRAPMRSLMASGVPASCSERSSARTLLSATARLLLPRSVSRRTSALPPCGDGWRAMNSASLSRLTV